VDPISGIGSPAGQAGFGKAFILLGLVGRSGGIRTHDPLTPSQVRYRAALHSGPRKSLYSEPWGRKAKVAPT
jgi:hypothetical protein